MFYAIYFFQRYPSIDTIKISYVYIEHENMENDIILERIFLDTYLSQLIELINNVENDTDFIRIKGPLCNYCQYLTHCSNDEE